MPRVLILHSSIDGHTVTICRCLQAMFAAAGLQTQRVALGDEDATALAEADLIVLGASIRYGRHRPAVAQFIQRHRALLATKCSALFSVNLVARKPGKDSAASNPYLRKLLARLAWQPDLADVFAGRLDYPHCRPLDRQIIRLIMWLTGGPTDPQRVFEFTDWRRVEAFGEACMQRLAAPPARPVAALADNAPQTGETP